MSRKFYVIDEKDAAVYYSLEEMAAEMDEEELDEIESGDKIVVVEVDIDVTRNATITISHKDFCQCDKCRQ